MSVPAVFVIGCLSVALAPIWLPILAVVDLVRRVPWAGVRCSLYLTWFAWCEIAGLSTAAWIMVTTIGRPDVRTSRLYALQRAWSSAVFDGARRIFGFVVEVAGQGEAAGTPMLLFLRHVSMADTLLASALVANVHGTRLRYVIKRELLIDPCLDIVGNQLPNYFVDRAAEDSGPEIDAIRALGSDLGEGDGVLIYPEGTRFTEAKHARIVKKLTAGDDPRAAARAATLRHVLPPRPSGVLALLAAAPDADVVIVAHRGFEAAGTFPSLWRGELVGRTIAVRIWRVERSQIPADREGQRHWLFDQWEAIDEWLQATSTTA